MTSQADTTLQQVTGLQEAMATARDRQLFDSIAGTYAAKDRYPTVAPARRLRLLQTLRVLPTDALTEARILEVGCGAGYASTYLPSTFHSYRGIDHSAELIHIAQCTHQSDNVAFEAADAKHVAGGRSYDIIFMVGVLHHMHERLEVLSHLVTLLRSGGWLVVNEPHPANPLIQFARRLRKRLDTAYSDEQLELSAADITREYRSVGLIDITSRPQGLVSTPFAEIPLRPSLLMAPLSHVACGIDRYVESAVGNLLSPFTWNIIVAGRKP